MKIRRLELHGFKSFSDPTSIEISEGIAAVVGPNGCGKSNLVDAIRWALGEMSPKQLRGMEMEDVIFNGSDTRRPLGMAEVTLAFENEGAQEGIPGPGVSPLVAAKEIQVTRRLYRTGESEYLINGTPSRLKDIVDLFLDTGVGAHAYAIIEQGQVTSLVDAPPQERRELLEEAAGVTRFRMRRREAERKLDATRENLVRVEDILGELRRQRSSLERQARKAERFRVLQEEARRLEIGLAVDRWRGLEARLADVRRHHGEAREREVERAAALRSGEAREESLRLQVAADERGLAAARGQVTALDEEARRIEGQIRANEEMAARHAEGAERLEGEAAKNEAEGAAIAREGEEARGTLEGGLDALRQAEAARAQAEGAAADLAQALESAEGEARRIDQAMVDLLVEESKGRTGKASLGARREELQGRHDRLTAEIAEIEARRQSLEETRGAQEARRMALRADAERIAEELVRTRQGVAEIEARLQGNRERLEASERDRVAAASRLESLEEFNRREEGYLGAVRAVLQWHRDKTAGGNTNGLVGVLADVIECDPAYERVVEAVLGERLQSVLVQSAEAGAEAVAYLKESGSGRGTFIPVNVPAILAPEGGEGLPGGALVRLSEVVRLKEAVLNGLSVPVQSILGQLLKNVVVVGDLPEALRAWKEGGGGEKTLVTLDGDVVEPNGSITGGGRGIPGEGLLRLRRDIEELRGRIASLEGKRGELASERSEAEGALARARATLQEMEQEKVRGAFAAEGAERESEQARLQAEAAARSLEAARFEREQLDRERTDLSKELEGLDARLAEIERARGERASEQAAHRAKMEEIRGRRGGVAEAAAAARERTARLEAECAALRRRVDDLLDRRNGILRSTEEKRSERDRLRAMAEGLTAQAAEAKGALGRVMASLEEARGTERSLSETVAETSAAIEALQGELKERRAAHEAAVGEVHQAEMDEQAARLNVDHLAETVRSRWEVDLARASAAAPEGPEGPTEEREARAAELRKKLDEMGEVNLLAVDEFRELDERCSALETQEQDLREAEQTLLSTIRRLEVETRVRFRETLESVNGEFRKIFSRLFGGGRAELRLVEPAPARPEPPVPPAAGEGAPPPEPPRPEGAPPPEDPARGEATPEPGVEIFVQPPGKRNQNARGLSGGEKALTAVSLLFAVFLVRPSPFCVLDEADAPLDDANIGRFNDLVAEMASTRQFILITHNKRTMELARLLYGVTMEEPGVSKVVSVQLH